MTARFLGGVVAAAAAVHVLFAALLVFGIQATYRHRVFDVTRLPIDPIQRYELIGTFLREHASDPRPSVLFAGSSFTYGFPWRETAIFSRAFADAHRDRHVMNASLLSADVSSINDWILCAAARDSLRFDTVVVEIPVVNTLQQMVANRDRHHVTPPISNCGGGEASHSLFDVLLRQPPTLGFLVGMWPAGSTPSEAEMVVAPVPDGYFVPAAAFASVREGYERQIAAVLRTARRVARTVYAYPSPVFVAGLSEIGRDEAALQFELARTVAACATVPEVHCIEASDLYGQQSSFYNFTHLNPRGHQAMAAWLSTVIRD
jgi:hypothetical protein